MFFVGFKAPSFLHIFAIRKMKSRTPEPELPIETKCLMYVNARSMVITDQLALIIDHRSNASIDLVSLTKNLLLRGHCPGRIFEDLRCNSVLLGSTLYLQ